MQSVELYVKAYGDCSVRVRHLPSEGVIVYEMDGFLPASETNAYIDDLLAAVRRLRPRGLIADPRKMKTLSEAFQRAVQTRFWPALAALGVRRNPAIVPEGFLASRSVLEMVDDAPIYAPDGIEGGVEIAVFGTFDECLAWIHAP